MEKSLKVSFWRVQTIMNQLASDFNTSDNVKWEFLIKKNCLKSSQLKLSLKVLTNLNYKKISHA